MKMFLFECRLCGIVKPVTEFYPHSGMSSGHLGECKECTRSLAKKRYHERWHQKQEYEKARYAIRRDSGVTMELQRRYRAKNPVKYKARTTVSNAIRDGKLQRKPCELCGSERAHAHHDDYSKPLDVKWVCWKCHRGVMHGHRVA